MPRFLESLLRRVLTPAAKYWVCKRGPAFVAEAMEVLGGSGYVEDSGLPRLYREAPVNSIWEGAGNVMCLDVLRALARAPEAFDAVLAETADAAAEPRIAALRAQVRRELAAGPAAEARARRIAEGIMLALQAARLVRHAPSLVAEAFCASRIDGLGGAFGTLLASADASPILRRVSGERGAG